jgi:hypothetical protein
VGDLLGVRFADAFAPGEIAQKAGLLISRVFSRLEGSYAAPAKLRVFFRKWGRIAKKFPATSPFSVVIRSWAAE